jgi:hypothetical protein
MQHQEYLDYRTRTLDSAKEQIGKYDRSVLFLSSGAIALSMAFLDKIVGQNAPVGVCVLAGAWAVFVLSLVAVVGSQFCGFKAAHFDVNQIEQAYSHPKYQWKRNPWNFGVELCNFASGIFFCTGAAALVMFAYQNIGR